MSLFKRFIFSGTKEQQQTLEATLSERQIDRKTVYMVLRYLSINPDCEELLKQEFPELQVIDLAYLRKRAAFISAFASHKEGQITMNGGEEVIMKNQEQLTEKQKWECVVRWLNRLYKGYCAEGEPEMPCGMCPYFQKECTVPPPVNFKVIEQFTGESTVVTTLINNKRTSLL